MANLLGETGGVKAKSPAPRNNHSPEKGSRKNKLGGHMEKEKGGRNLLKWKEKMPQL